MLHHGKIMPLCHPGVRQQIQAAHSSPSTNDAQRKITQQLSFRGIRVNAEATQETQARFFQPQTWIAHLSAPHAKGENLCKQSPFRNNMPRLSQCSFLVSVRPMLSKAGDANVTKVRKLVEV